MTLATSRKAYHWATTLLPDYIKTLEEDVKNSKDPLIKPALESALRDAKTDLKEIKEVNDQMF